MDFDLMFIPFVGMEFGRSQHQDLSISSMSLSAVTLVWRDVTRVRLRYHSRICINIWLTCRAASRRDVFLTIQAKTMGH